MNFLYKQKFQLLSLAIYLTISCTNDPTLIQLPDRTSPSGYIVSPLDGSSVKGNTTLQVIAIDNEKVDTVYFMIKAENADNYESIDFSTIEANDTWEGDWDTRNAQWQENENYFDAFSEWDNVVTELNIMREEFYKKELTFQVSCSYGPGRYDSLYEEHGQDYPVGFVRWTEQRNFEAVLDMMASGTLEVKSLITHRFKIDDGADAYKLLDDSSALGIVLEYPEKTESSEHCETGNRSSWRVHTDRARK